MTETKELIVAIEKLEATLDKNNSPRWNFYRGVMYGLGFFIGGTLLVSVIIYIASLSSTAPVIGSYISKLLHILNSK